MGAALNSFQSGFLLGLFVAGILGFSVFQMAHWIQLIRAYFRQQPVVQMTNTTPFRVGMNALLAAFSFGLTLFIIALAVVNLFK